MSPMLRNLRSGQPDRLERRLDRHHRRITMNPPESFIQYAALTNPQTEQVNNPIVVGQGGQAVMVPPAALGNGDTGTDASKSENQDSQGGEIQLAPNSATVSSDTDTATATATATPTAASSVLTSNAVLTTSSEASSQVSPTSTATSAITSTPSASATDDLTSSAVTSTGTFTPSASSRPPSLTSTSSTIAHSTASSSSIPSPSSTIAAADTQHAPFTHTAPFIFLCVLGILVLVAILATSLSWIFRRPWFPCCNRPSDDDDDGLSDIVQSFHSHTPSRSSTIRRSAYSVGLDDPESALHRRSSMFAEDPSKSPFLHSGDTATMWDLTGEKGNGAPSIAVPAPAHLYGETGPLEIRNAVPGDMEAVTIHNWREDHGTPREEVAGSTPRFLGVDGGGLDVPWGRQTSSELIGLGIQTYPDSTLTSPYVSAPDARDYLGQPFSPSTKERDTATSSPEHGSPQRAGTWASNLRNTLFAAIAGARTAGIGGDEDRFTRPVLPLHRNSTRRKLEAGDESHAFPIVEEEKDEYNLPHSDAEAIGSVFLVPTLSASSASTTSTVGVVPPRRAKMPLRGGAAERYKRYYARSSNSGSSEESGTDTASSWSVDDRVPSRLAGGERAKGVKGAA